MGVCAWCRLDVRDAWYRSDIEGGLGVWCRSDVRGEAGCMV